MKTLRYILILALTVSIGSGVCEAQTRKEKKQAEIKSMVEAKTYTFIADYALPMHGGQKNLTSEYDLRVTPDSVISFLPYYGVVHFDPPYNPTDGGIKFTSTKFDYNGKQKKNGGWEISISPRDVRNLQRMTLTISTDGYATLNVTSVNRDFISFEGHLEKNKLPKGPDVVSTP